jgi:hypothetical protein
VNRFNNMIGKVPGLLCLLCALLIAVQSTPVRAATDDGGFWVEICSENGAELVRLDGSGSLPANQGDCPDCSTCPFCSSVSSPDPACLHQASECGRSRAGGAWAERVPAFLSEAGFWPQVRGPPALTADIPPAGPCLPEFFRVGVAPWAGHILSGGSLPSFACSFR